jgi:hypothetical protein
MGTDMTTIDQMWQKFAAHQPVADRLGYGEAWRRMCEERTEDAFYDAADAVDAVDAADAANAVDAACAAWALSRSGMARASSWANRLAERAIEYINKAEGRS